ncbi:MAG TPA: DUF6597 domain-containing transcriptional factor, partial [Aggregatilineales bacterium]|nr:DUF6597 domain-containing transcriptional factor [Aggregatilineales bacterium]
MTYLQIAPHPILADTVKSLWATEHDFHGGQDSIELLPDSYVEMVFSVGAQRWLETDSETYNLPGCYLIGLLNKPLRMRANGLVKSVAVRFFAWGFYSLFDL